MSSENQGLRRSNRLIHAPDRYGEWVTNPQWASIHMQNMYPNPIVMENRPVNNVEESKDIFV